MTMLGKRSVFLPFLVAAAVSLQIGCTSTPQVNVAAEEKAILDAEAAFSEAAASKDLEKVLAFYAEDAVMLEPNQPIARGKTAIRASWTRSLALPNLAISWKPDKAEVAKGGDLAFDFGSYSMSYTGPAGRKVNDQGKFTSFWKKQADGTWKVVVDAFNTDVGAPQPAAAKKKAAPKKKGR